MARDEKKRKSPPSQATSEAIAKKKSKKTSGAEGEKPSGDAVLAKKKQKSQRRGGRAPPEGKPAKKFKSDKGGHHGDAVAPLLRLWNQLRDKQVPSKERTKLVNEVAIQLRGKYAAMSLKHDASRVVQAVVSYGTPEQVDEVLEEVESRIMDLSISPYAHFLVVKLLKSAALPRRRDFRRKIVRALGGHMLKLGTHSVGARVVETALAELPRRDAKSLHTEFYGREHLLATGGGSDQSYRLADLLKMRPDRREAILTKLWTLLSKMTDKGLCQFVYVQDLLCEYLECAGPPQIAKVVPALAEHSVALLASRNGSKAAAMLAAYGGARERRKMIKALKGNVKSCIFHRDAYMFLLKLVSVTDDTVSIKKNVLPEIFARDDEQFTASGEEKTAEYTTEMLMTSQSTTLFFLWLLAPEAKRYFHDEAVKKIMQPSTLPPEGIVVGLETPPEEIDTSSWVSTSKKSPEQRQREVLAYLRGHLVDLVVEHAQVMLYNPHGGRLLLEVATRWRPQALYETIVKEMTNIPSQKASDEGDEDDDQEVQDELPVWEHPKAHLILKWLLVAEGEATSGDNAEDEDSETGAEQGGSLAETFMEELSEELLELYLGCNRGAFVIEALSKVPSVRARLLKQVGFALRNSAAVKSSLKNGNKALVAMKNETEAKAK